jgi:asparagine synthase (glutamine-hydrolysing)
VLPYISLAWNSRDPILAQAATRILARLLDLPSQWVVCFQKPGLRVLLSSVEHKRPELVRFCNGAGVILGTIFPYGTPATASSETRCLSLSHSEEADVLNTGGRSLVRSHWGSYILFLTNSNTADVHVLRGPMSAIPCFWADVAGLTMFFSRPPDLTDVGILPTRINWDHIRAQSARGDYICEETGLLGIFTLISGDCLALQAGRRTHHYYWTPTSSGLHPIVSDIDTAADLLRSSTRATINCWSSLHESIIVSLSGGFDSSIVLGCAITAPTKPEIRAVNLCSPRSGDERRYARSMARKCRVPLHEVDLPDNVDLGLCLGCSRTASPVLRLTAFATEQLFLRFSEEFAASSVFTGELGDNVLGHGYGPEVLAEAFWRYRLTRPALRALLDYATLYRVSIWRAAKLAISECKVLRGVRTGGMFEHLKARGVPTLGSLTTADAMAQYESMAPRFVHKWFRDATCGPPGWLQTIASLIILTSTSTHSAFSEVGDTLFLSPLVSQPVVEASLTIPAQLHISGGAHAAVARRAFAPQLSTAVLSRGRSKGTSDYWLRDVIVRNRPFLRELLLEGALVKERILDRRKTELALSGEVSGSRVGVVDVLTQLYIECWLRRWTGNAGSDRPLLH